MNEVTLIIHACSQCYWRCIVCSSSLFICPKVTEPLTTYHCEQIDSLTLLTISKGLSVEFSGILNHVLLIGNQELSLTSKFSYVITLHKTLFIIINQGLPKKVWPIFAKKEPISNSPSALNGSSDLQSAAQDWVQICVFNRWLCTSRWILQITITILLV